MTDTRIRALVAILLTLIMANCDTPRAENSQTKFDSAHSIALDGLLEAGRIISDSDDPAIIEGEIREQMMFAVGQLNGIGGGVDMHRLIIEVDSVTDHDSGGFEASYLVKLFISWPRHKEIPSSYKLYLPESGHWKGIRSFYESYGSDEEDQKECLAWEAHDVTSSMFWYYYRPEKFGCSVSSDLVAPHVVSPSVELFVSAENTEGKFPEYDKVWEDGRLEVTAIFGKGEFGSQSNWDAGVRGVVNTYDALVALLGEPTSSSISGERPSIENNFAELTFETPKGVVDVHLYLIDDIKSVSLEFRRWYNERTKTSDFVAYNGHSGLGANIRALAQMGEFVKDHYQIFLINGCDTFAYVDDSLRLAHQAVNPDAGMDKYVDVITNAMPAFFGSMANANLAVVEGLVGSEKTYREILESFDSYQKAAVTGEEDNSWPLDF